LAWVSVVVVEVAGVAGVVVVLVVVVGDVAQPVSDTRVTATKQERMIFFIMIMVVWLIT
jgi:hypothetical protein